MRLSQSTRLGPVLTACALLLCYVVWFDSYTRSSPPPAVTLHVVPTTQPAPARPPKRILLVSALYPLQKSKHTDAQYLAWLARFLAHISTDVYFFTTPALAPLVRRARLPGLGSITINTTFASPFDIPPLHGVRPKYTQMHGWDREAARHSPELYAVWNAKPWFLDQALRNIRGREHAAHACGTSCEYDYAFWTDAGSFRHEHAYHAWPDPARVEEVWEAGFQLLKEQWAGWDGVNGMVYGGLGGDQSGRERERERRRQVTVKEDLMLFPIFELPGRDLAAWQDHMGPVDVDFSEGTFFGSTPRTIAWYSRTFYAYHAHYLSTAPASCLPPFASPPHPHAPPPQNTTQCSSPSPSPPFHFTGKDQTLINALLFLYPHRFLTVLAPVRTHLLADALARTNANANTPRHTSAAARIWSALGRRRCGDEWFYYQYWLASAGERAGMRRMWAAAVGWWPWWWFGSEAGGRRQAAAAATATVEQDQDQGGERHGGCPVERVVTVEGVLRAVFGKGWVVPEARVQVG